MFWFFVVVAVFIGWVVSHWRDDGGKSSYQYKKEKKNFKKLHKQTKNLSGSIASMNKQIKQMQDEDQIQKIADRYSTAPAAPPTKLNRSI